ncbi:MAG: hypothetical protein ACE5FQ_13575 [Thiogranum sp.]
MAFYEVYIGREPEPDETFSWDGGDWSGNQPPSIGAGRFPPTDCKEQPFDILHSRIYAEYYEGKQTDWGCWAAKASKQQVLEFIDTCYRDDKSHDDPAWPYRYDGYRSITEAANNLDPDSSYYLVAIEEIGYG